MAKTLEQAKANFTDAAFSKQEAYRQNTEGKGSKWKASAGRAKANYTPAMQQALQEKSYDDGIDRADATDYDTGVRDKGANNWPVGMQAGADKFAERVGKFVPLWDRELPTARGPKRGQANMKRMTENVMRFIETAK